MLGSYCNAVRSLLRFSVVVLAGLAITSTVPQLRAESPASDDLVSPATREKLLAYLEEINAWVMTLDVSSGDLKNLPPKETRTSIFCNANLARVLLSSYNLTGNEEYLKEGLRWCDNFVCKQQLTLTPDYQEAGYWGDLSPTGNIYFGDTGTATTALSMGYRLAASRRQKVYLNTMERYARFVTQGCLIAPHGRGQEPSSGWIIAEGPESGAVGCGYYRGHLSTPPYVIATATTGGAFFSELYEITKNPAYRKVAIDSVRWIANSPKPSGEIPYVLDGKTSEAWPLDTLAYCAEAFVAVDLYAADPETKAMLAQKLRPTLEWFLSLQNDDGSWGELRSADQQRSPRAVTFLSWWYREVEPDPRVAQAVRKYCAFLLDPENSKAYGIKELIRTTGFVGLAVAEILQKSSTF